MTMRILSQRDPLWAQLPLGASKLTVGRFGCTTTCISMLSDYFGCFRTPAQIARVIEYYTGGGLIIWKKLGFSLMAFERRLHGRDDVEIHRALKDPKRAVILEVNNGAHWVVALRSTLIGNSYIVADPWDGTKVDVIKRYHNITGAAYFRAV